MLLSSGLAAVALATAALSGMAGMGGGTLLIAAMFTLGLAPALALSLHAAVQLVANASRSLAFAAHIRWSALALFALAALPGPFLVAPWVVNANPDWIRLALGLFVALAVWPGWAKRLRIHGRVGMLAAGVIAGALGPIVGATGILVAPFFVRDDWRRQEIIATLAAAQAGSHLFKVAAFSISGFDVLARLDLLVPMAIAAVIGTLIGRRLVGQFSEDGFRRLVRAIMLVLSIKLAWDGLTGLLG